MTYDGIAASSPGIVGDAVATVTCASRQQSPARPQGLRSLPAATFKPVSLPVACYYRQVSGRVEQSVGCMCIFCTSYDDFRTKKTFVLDIWPHLTCLLRSLAPRMSVHGQRLDRFRRFAMPTFITNKRTYTQTTTLRLA